MSESFIDDISNFNCAQIYYLWPDGSLHREPIFENHRQTEWMITKVNRQTLEITLQERKMIDVIRFRNES